MLLALPACSRSLSARALMMPPPISRRFPRSRGAIACQNGTSFGGAFSPGEGGEGGRGAVAGGVGEGEGCFVAGGFSNSGGFSWARNGPPTAARIRASHRTVRLIVDLLRNVRAGARREGACRPGILAAAGPASQPTLGGRKPTVDVGDDVLDVLAAD